VTNAQAMITALDTAIQSVSTTRAGLGARQNRLEHTIASLGVAHENMAASRSRILDADMAEEMTGFTKLQILQQAGMAILAQANQAPQSVLSLLR
jgi:flagellin